MVLYRAYKKADHRADGRRLCEETKPEGELTYALKATVGDGIYQPVL